jgi:hypothetical protein
MANFTTTPRPCLKVLPLGAKNALKFAVGEKNREWDTSSQNEIYYVLISHCFTRKSLSNDMKSLKNHALV